MQLKILGCGSSMGVPRPDGDFGNCDPKEIKNHRTRCSALIKTKKMNILIDTSPDLRTQLLKNKVKNIDKVLFSHMHADQCHGINDLRVFFIKIKKLYLYMQILLLQSIWLKLFHIVSKKILMNIQQS